MSGDGETRADQKQVQRAAKLLKMRGTGDAHRKVVVEKKLKEMPPHVVARAHAHVGSKARPATGSSHDDTSMKAETITIGDDDTARAKLQQGEAQTAIANYVTQYVQTLQHGHNEGYASFRVWYRAWEHAKESATFDVAKEVFSFLLEQGLEVIFPEEEAFFKVLKVVAIQGYKAAASQLGAVDKGDIEGFLDSVWKAEEHEINSLLDVPDKFFETKSERLDAAVDSFVFARMDGWDTTGKLPSQTITILQELGVGAHGSAAATLVAERVLAAHIRSVYQSDESVRQGAGDNDLGVMAEIDALRAMQNLPAIDNREKMWELQRRLNPYFHSMVDINSESAEMMHVRFGIDRDDAHDIVRSRDEHGPFSSPDDLLTRKLVTREVLSRIEGRIVCH